MNGSCQCGAVAFTTPTPKPVELWHCHCTDCQKQSGSAFGTSAFFPYFEVSEEKGNGPVGSFVRVCDSGNRQKCYFCTNCGGRILNARIEKEGGFAPIVSVRGGLLEGLNWTDAKHIFCRSAVVPIPEGAVRCEGPPDFK